MRDGFFTTGDGVRLRYVEAGEGPALLMHPAWTLPGHAFHKQISALAEKFRVIVLDPRGHGESEKPAYGYRLSRLAVDLQELLDYLSLDDVSLLGHSAGCCVLWTYFDLFGEDRVRSWIFCDQMAARLMRPEWSQDELADYGSEVEARALQEAANAIAGPEGEAMARQFLRMMFTPSFPEAEAVALVEETLKMPRSAAGAYLRSVAYGDFRDIFPRMRKPALVFGGGASHLSPRAMPWIAGQIPDSELVIIPADAGGSHFMFLENPELFNAALIRFLGRA